MDQLVETYIQQIKEVYPQRIDAFTIHEGGDDFLVLEINSEWMFRFPRNESPRKVMGIETDFLKAFADFSPLPVPVRSFIDKGFVGYRKIQGEPLSFETFAELSKPTRNRIAEQLGVFLSAIHSFSLEEIASNQSQIWIKYL